jgi:hypothetical protein
VSLPHAWYSAQHEALAHVTQASSPGLALHEGKSSGWGLDMRGGRLGWTFSVVSWHISVSVAVIPRSA